VPGIARSGGPGRQAPLRLHLGQLGLDERERRRVPTHGDGSASQPGCDLDGKSTAGWPYDDSKLYQAKAAIIDTISAFGSAEFALATYARVLLGQPCQTDSDCAPSWLAPLAWTCPTTPRHRSTASGTWAPTTWNARRAQAASRAPTHPTPTIASSSGANSTAPRVVPIPPLVPGRRLSLASPRRLQFPRHLPLDRRQGGPASVHRNLKPGDPGRDPDALWRAASTPCATGCSMGPGPTWGRAPGLLSSNSALRDPRAACRPYGIVLVTDGEDSCSPDGANDPVKAASDAYQAGITVYVVGFGTGTLDSLSRMATAGSGGKKSVYLANNRADLAASLGDIIVNSIPVPRCNCDATCYDEAVAFPQKGKPCSVGVGRCKRQGVYACNATGDGVMCAVAAACGASPLVAGTPTQEVCGTAPGCLAPTAADCADENCDGQIDEGLSCDCAYQPEVCNGLDDNCNGIVDDVPSVSCGASVGECRPGTTACVSDGAGGKETVCQGAVGPQLEICDNKDNDCDGVIDGLVQACFPVGSSGCTFDSKAGTWTCKGICATGMQSCVAGVWQNCVAATTPQTEIPCDGRDNNCDGQVDENDPISSTPCYPTGAVGCDVSTGKCVGVCAFGHQACQTNPITGKSELGCVGAVTPTAELCNGKDDDCDGSVDEDFPNLGKPCNTQSCQGAGHYICNASGTDVVCTVNSLGPTPPPPPPPPPRSATALTMTATVLLTTRTRTCPGLASLVAVRWVNADRARAPAWTGRSCATIWGPRPKCATGRTTIAMELSTMASSRRPRNAIRPVLRPAPPFRANAGRGTLPATVRTAGCAPGAWGRPLRSAMARTTTATAKSTITQIVVQPRSVWTALACRFAERTSRHAVPTDIAKMDSAC
jgi:hypothetical protein